MDPPPFKGMLPPHHSPTSEDGTKGVWQPLICGVFYFYSSYATCWIIGAWICHIAREGQVGGWHVKMDYVLWYCRFPTISFVWTLNPNVEPSLLPLTCVAHLLAMRSTNEKLFKELTCTSLCITQMQNSTNFAFYISLKAELFWIWNRASWNCCCCRTLPSISDEDVQVIFYALDNNGDFKAHFVHRFLTTANIFLAKSEILHQVFEVYY